ncbi:MAG: magnesium chelatase, partial [Bacteroidota bacterium]
RFRDDFNNTKAQEVEAVMNAGQVRQFSKMVEGIYIKDDILDYIAELIYNTRNHGDLFLGASPRASLSISKASKALAAVRGRDFVTPDDVKFVLKPVLNHRIILSPDKELEGMEPEDVVDDIVQKVEVPR